MVGRCLTRQNSRRILALVSVRGILGGKNAPLGVSGNDRTLSDDSKLKEIFCCGVGKRHSGRRGRFIGMSGNHRALSDDTKLEKNSGCGVSKRHSG